ncbi:MAG: hypothetical protein H0V17_11275 [Deltaproteobacteria bacterium]|nr:hypothetical protein [Deltaproteobacteria bacterium]
MRIALVVLVLGCGGGEFPSPVFDPKQNWGGNLAVHEGRVYTTTINESCGGIDPGFDHAVWSVSAAAEDGRAGPANRDEQLIFCGANHQLFGFGMTVADGRVFWSGDGDDGVGAIYAAPIEGGERELMGSFNTGTAANAGLATDGEHVYAATFDEILRVPLAGGGPETVFEQITFEAGWFDVIDGAVFANTWGGGSTPTEVMKMNLDGSARVVLDVLPDLQPAQFCDDAEALYFTRSDSVVRVPKDGTESTVFAFGLATPRGCAVLDGDVYTSLGGIEADTLKQIVRLRPGNVVEVVAEVEGTVVFLIEIADRVLHYAGLGAFGRLEL